MGGGGPDVDDPECLGKARRLQTSHDQYLRKINEVDDIFGPPSKRRLFEFLNDTAAGCEDNKENV